MREEVVIYWLHWKETDLHEMKTWKLLAIINVVCDLYGISLSHLRAQPLGSWASPWRCGWSARPPRRHYRKPLGRCHWSRDYWRRWSSRHRGGSSGCYSHSRGGSLGGSLWHFRMLVISNHPVLSILHLKGSLKSWIYFVFSLGTPWLTLLGLSCSAFFVSLISFGTLLVSKYVNKLLKYVFIWLSQLSIPKTDVSGPLHF